MAWAITTIALIVGVAATVAGVSYQIYSSENPPKNPKQATQALNDSQRKRGILQTKLASASPKEQIKIQKAINHLDTSISFLQNWIQTYGDTKAPKVTNAADANFAKITNVMGAQSPVADAAPIPAPHTNTNLMFTVIGVFIGLISLALVVFRRKRKG